MHWFTIHMYLNQCILGMTLGLITTDIGQYDQESVSGGNRPILKFATVV